MLCGQWFCKKNMQSQFVRSVVNKNNLMANLKVNNFKNYGLIYTIYMRFDNL